MFAFDGLSSIGTTMVADALRRQHQFNTESLNRKFQAKCKIQPALSELKFMKYVNTNFTFFKKSGKFLSKLKLFTVQKPENDLRKSIHIIR